MCFLPHRENLPSIISIIGFHIEAFLRLAPIGILRHLKGKVSTLQFNWQEISLIFSTSILIPINYFCDSLPLDQMQVQNTVGMLFNARALPKEASPTSSM